MVARYIGSQEISKVYVGSNLVWQKEQPADYFYLASSASPINVSINNVGSAPSVNLQYSTDGTTWQSYTIGTTISNVSKVYFRGLGNTTFATNEDNYHSIVTNATSSNTLIAGGNIMTLLDYQQEVTMGNYAFVKLFEGCTYLTTTPELPAIELANYCYYALFRYCKSLVSDNLPELPATTLKESCYRQMFNGCTGLTSSPELPATTLVRNCYNKMFIDCSKLNEVTILATSVSATDCLNDWLDGAKSTGTFRCKSGVSYKSGTSGKPYLWTRVNI